MSVNLSIVGIFYNNPIDTSSRPGGPYSVKDIMDFASHQKVENKTGVVSALKYSFAKASGTPPAEYVDFIAATYSAAPGFKPPPTSIVSISGRHYPLGTYALSQTATTAAANVGSASYTVWQYYVFDAGHKVVKVGPKAEVPFNETRVVENGFSIIWRLVTISSRPVVPNARVARLFGVLSPAVPGPAAPPAAPAT